MDRDLFGHVKGEWPHLEKITDTGDLEAELTRVRADYNGMRLHASIGYVTPDDEHQGRGDATRKARRDGLDQARQERSTTTDGVEDNERNNHEHDARADG